MALSNAERQKRRRERLRQKAAEVVDPIRVLEGCAEGMLTEWVAEIRQESPGHVVTAALEEMLAEATAAIWFCESLSRRCRSD